MPTFMNLAEAAIKFNALGHDITELEPMIIAKACV